MEENETITRYYAVITTGDEYHPEGERHLVSPPDIDRVKEQGLCLEILDDRYKTVYHMYPVAITKNIYRLDLIETETVQGGDRSSHWGQTIGHFRCEKDERDWRDHWC